MTDAPTWEVAAQIAVARHRGTLDRDDALQDARLAAWRALGRWRPDGGTTAITWCIERASGALIDQRRTIARRAARLRMVPLRVEVATVDRHPGLEAAAVDATIAELGAGPRESASLWRLAFDAA
jgi:DNA-directed RNA polymerase specialized sigma24 family protein